MSIHHDPRSHSRDTPKTLETVLLIPPDSIERRS
jgi:hypothetical protein